MNLNCLRNILMRIPFNVQNENGFKFMRVREFQMNINELRNLGTHYINVEFAFFKVINLYYFIQE